MKVLNAVVRLYERHYIAVLIFLLALSLGAAWVAAGLRLDADLEALLPADAPSVEGLRELEEAYGHVGRLTVVLTADAVEEARGVAVELGDRIAAWDEVERVEVERPVEFFDRFRLLYVRYDDLEEAADRVRQRIRHERAQANPLFVDLGTREPPPVDLSDIEERYDHIGDTKFFESDDGRHVVFFIYPHFSPADLHLARTLLNRVRAEADALITEDYPAVQYGLTGRYMKRVEQQEIITADLTQATLMAVVLLTLFLLVYLRSIAAMGLVIVPLLVGTVWAFAWASLVFGELNILTGFLGAILLGIGVDYGIHLVNRFFECRAEGEPVGAALAVTMFSAGRASLFAGLTTMVALGSLTVSSFQAFFEFGVVALGGMALVLLAYATVFPTLVLTFSHFRLRPRQPLSVLGATAGARWLKAEAGVGRRRLRVLQRGSLVAITVLVLLAAVGLPDVELSRDFRTLQVTDTPSWELDGLVNEILGQSQTPAVVLVEDGAHADRVVEELRRRQAETPQGYTISEVIGPGDALPSDQGEKLDLIAEMRDDLLSVPEGERSDDLESYLDELEDLLDHGPLRWEELPQSLRLPFERRDDVLASVVLVFSDIPIEEAQTIEDYAVVMRHLPGPRGAPLIRLDAISDALMLADIIEFVRRDTVWMVLLTLLGLLVIGLIAFGPSREFLWLFATLGLCLGCAVGLVALIGLKFNFVNLIVLPVWLGLTVDASFHMYQRFAEEPDRIQPHLSVSGAVAAAFVTSMVGFGVLLLARHEGLQSLGQVALMGLGTILLVNLFLQAVHIGRHQFAEVRAVDTTEEKGDDEET
ncbi:MAG: efflux RND transporter permease subunit [Bradymonadaceae bacterium]